MDYIVTIANKNDKSLIQTFIDKYWKKNHSLTISSELFDFQHYDSIRCRYNFILAKAEDSSQEILSLMGFIPTYKFDPNLYENGDYWGAIWKKREDVKSDMAGIDVFSRLYDEPNFHSYAAIGVSEIALKLYKLWGCHTGVLSQYYIINNLCESFKIAKNVTNNQKKPHSSYLKENGWDIKIMNYSEVMNSNVSPFYRPYKSICYLLNRYVKHPIYKYKFFGVFYKETLISVWVVRCISVGGNFAIRVVDVLGEVKGSLYDCLLSIMHSKNIEYIDFMNYGIDEKVFFSMGFRKLDISGDLIIPNYFEPFERRNIQIDIAYNADYENYVVFKGDSDQDRPNAI